MKAVYCIGLDNWPRLEMREIATPEPGPGEVLICNEAWGVNFVDYLMCQGGYQLRPQPPFIPGMESAGRVVALGDGVERIEIGDAFMAGHRPGAFAENTCVPVRDLIPIADSMNMAEAAGFRSAFITAYHGLLQGGRLQMGETALIHGAAGGTGHAAVQVAKRLGATVIATASGEEKLRVIRSLGADHAIEYDDGFRDAVKDLTGGRGADVIFDPIGGDVFDESMRCLNWGARIVIVGFTAGRPALAKTNHILIKGASVTGIRAGEFCRRNPDAAAQNLETLLSWAAAGDIRTHISHRFPLD
ncbi:MAG: NADPH:quinone oxidoreductase family protein, partial [Alphaproteobacteria bacterium]|nr:NADPH:quinone oxidoreductase family protein [Alphaproteobacteria bacterium]